MISPRLFQKTRLQLAGWYAVGMGIVVSVGGGYVYMTANQSYWAAVHQELDSLVGVLHDSLEPKLKIPGVVDPAVQQEVLTNICLVGESCAMKASSDRHILSISHQEGYYVRLYDLSRKLIATVGHQPVGTDAEIDRSASMSFHDGQGVHYHRLFQAITTADGRPWGFLQVGRSMAEFDREAAKLQRKLLVILPAITLSVALISWWLAGQAMQPIKSSYEKMQQFTADAAHELRTPLAAILATVEAAQPPESIAEATEALDTVERQTNRLIQLAEDLLILLQTSANNIDRATCQINVVIAESVKSLSTLQAAAGIQLDLVMPGSVPVTVSMNESQASRLITNLVVNALQYTSPGGVITVQLEQVNNCAVIQVQDTGIGIAASEQAHIFDRFYRVNYARTRLQGGAGLGLAIVKSIIQAHHGSIEVKSKLGEGSTFTIRLPVAKFRDAEI
jgi:signal transduction histidine kinase